VSTTFVPFGADTYPIDNPYDPDGREVYGIGDHESVWRSHYFGYQHLVPAAEGGFATDDYAYSRAGFMVCSECRSVVFVKSDSDMVPLNAHRAWHDKMNG
jgi:hypothetical protein